MINKGMFTSDKQDWTTPKELFDELNKEFNFDCDLFASDENSLCDYYYTKENSAFEYSWFPVNFANPPYETKIQNKAFQRAHSMAVHFGNITVMLVPARTDTKRFQDIVFKYGYEVRFLSGRIKFGVKCTQKILDKELQDVKKGKRKNSRVNSKDLGRIVYLDPAPFPSCIIIFKRN